MRRKRRRNRMRRKRRRNRMRRTEKEEQNEEEEKDEKDRRKKDRWIEKGGGSEISWDKQGHRAALCVPVPVCLELGIT